MCIFDFNIIDWRKLDISKFWPGLFFTICHPIYAWKYERHCYNSFFDRCYKFFRETLPSYTPFSKACRWLTNELINRICDTKYLETFYCRKHGDYTTYYFGKAIFGHYSIYELYYRKVGNGYVKKPRKTKIISGWVWRKKTAIKLLKTITMSKPELYANIYTPEPGVSNPYLMCIANNMKNILLEGKFITHEIIDIELFDKIFLKSKDNIEKLWCYVGYLLSCPNDFHAHEKLAWIFRISDSYLYYKKIRKNMNLDPEFINMKKAVGEKEARKYELDLLKEWTKSKVFNRLSSEINELLEYYRNLEYEYFRI